MAVHRRPSLVSAIRMAVRNSKRSLVRNKIGEIEISNDEELLLKSMGELGAGPVTWDEMLRANKR